MATEDALPLEPYLTYWRNRQEKDLLRNEKLREAAWADVEKIAVLLREEFTATRIIVFGSLAKARFFAGSDIDLAVAGLRKEDLFPAMAQAGELSQFHVDIKPLEELDPGFKERIISTGKEV